MRGDHTDRAGPVYGLARAGWQVQTQLGPGSQEMGGFWPSADTALANWAAGEGGSAGETVIDAVLGASDESATVWQAWQAAQDSQCAAASGVIGAEVWPAP